MRRRYRWLLFTLVNRDDKWTETERARMEGQEERGGDRTHRGQLVVRPGSGIWTQVAGGAWAPEGPARDQVEAGQGAGGLQG